MRKLRAFAALSVLLFFIACSVKPDIQEVLPGGRWVVASATRDGKPTGTLTDLYFEFHANDSLVTNITGVPGEMRWYVQDGVIQQRKGSFDADYKVQKMTADEMEVATTLNGSEFVILFSKRAF
ncbi:MAG: hypothetical protein IAE84_19175 [Saprospiraceae bacterium]|nr:hypothetical protein [Saprospiraceae bacterium]HRD81778.1 hypothetical protein [Saprospiraceae bacterium]HRK83949.1 hypothetical protein [Saprospiraceae bacterium]